MEWINVEDKLPDTIGSYLIFANNCFICMAFYNSNGEWCEMWSQQKLKVKHWMNLPKPPNSTGGNSERSDNTTNGKIKPCSDIECTCYNPDEEDGSNCLCYNLYDMERCKGYSA